MHRNFKKGTFKILTNGDASQLGHVTGIDVTDWTSVQVLEAGGKMADMLHWKQEKFFNTNGCHRCRPLQKSKTYN